MEPRTSSGTRHFHEMRVFVRPYVAALHLFARIDEAQRERDGLVSAGLPSKKVSNCPLGHGRCVLRYALLCQAEFFDFT